MKDAQHNLDIETNERKDTPPDMVQTVRSSKADNDNDKIINAQ
jgi:hypothetical protein